MRAQIKQAHERLMSIRNSNHQHAGGLIIAKDCDHANALAEIVKEITGEEPCLIHTRTKDASRRLRSYQTDTSTNRTKWLISVMKVTEGVDIKHLRVCVYLTHKTAPLLWTQILGRILRVESGVYGDQTAHFYQYDDGVDSIDVDDIDSEDNEESVRLRFYSETIKEQRDAVLKPSGDRQPTPQRECRTCKELGYCPGTEDPRCPKRLRAEETVQFHGATGFQEEQIYDGEHFKLSEMEIVKPLSHLWGEPEVICKSKLDKLPKEQREFMYRWLETQLT